MLDITNLYAYRIEELAVGIVRAESYEDAREKVKAAYLKHNDCFDWGNNKSGISNMLDEIDKEPLLEEVLNNGKVIASKAYCDAETKYFMRYQIIKYNKMLYLIEYKEKECVTFEKLQ